MPRCTVVSVAAVAAAVVADVGMVTLMVAELDMATLPAGFSAPFCLPSWALRLMLCRVPLG